jgi:predicted flap endonuclease-1-like 5' DNA nuclease
MNVLAALVLGLLIGWLIEWIIDWFYWRARMQAAIAEKPSQDGLDKVNSILEEENTILMREHKNLDEENSRLKERVGELETEINQIKASAMIGHLLSKDGTHNLQAIKGIGPAFAKRLNESGVHTFEELGQLTAQDMERILGTLYKRFFAKKNNILPQAKDFAALIATAQGKRKA